MENMVKNTYFITLFTSFAFFMHGGFGVGSDRVSVLEGDSVTLHTDVETNEQEEIKWYFNDLRIAQISGDRSVICTDVQCNEGTERFRDRLKLDHQTGSLTIMNTRTTDSGDYTLEIIGSNSASEKSFSVTVSGVSPAERDEMKRETILEALEIPALALHPGQIAGIVVSLVLLLLLAAVSAVLYYRHETSEQRQKVKKVTVLKEGSAILHTNIKIQKDDVILWTFVDMAKIKKGGTKKISISDGPNERFGDRLKVNHQTGSLTIMNTRTTDSGDYNLQIISNGKKISVETFSVTVFDEIQSVGVRKGDPLTLDTDAEIQRDNDKIQWMFGDEDALIAKNKKGTGEITFDDGADGRFRGRLKVNQTGSLTITNTRTTDSGEYKLKIVRSGNVSFKLFSVSVSGEQLRSYSVIMDD